MSEYRTRKTSRYAAPCVRPRVKGKSCTCPGVAVIPSKLSGRRPRRLHLARMNSQCPTRLRRTAPVQRYCVLRKRFLASDDATADRTAAHAIVQDRAWGCAPHRGQSWTLGRRWARQQILSDCCHLRTILRTPSEIRHLPSFGR